jgi:hypothetical protein
VGVDNLSYANIFDHGKIVHDGKEELWKWFVGTMQSLHIHWVITMGICGFVQIYFITKSLKPYRWLLVFIPFLFFGGRYWFDCMNAMRQMMAASIFLWASRYIQDRKIIRYLVIIFICSMIHNSALILLPLILLPSISIEKHRWKLIAIFIGCFIIGKTPQFQSLGGMVDTIATTINYDWYAKSMSTMLKTGYTGETLSYGPMMISYLLIPIFIIWYGPELKAQYEEYIPYFSLWYNLAYIYACLYFLVCNLGLFIRPVMYFSLFQMVMGAILLHYLWTEYKAYGAKQIATLVFCAVVAVNTTWDVTKAATSGNYYETSTYKTIFFHQDLLDHFGLSK